METTPSLIGILVGVAEPLSPGSVEIREQKCMRGWMDRYGKEGRSVCTEAPSLPSEAVMYVKAVHEPRYYTCKVDWGAPPSSTPVLAFHFNPQSIYSFSGKDPVCSVEEFLPSVVAVRKMESVQHHQHV